MADTGEDRFIHSKTARLLALVIALALALIAFLAYQDDIGKPLIEQPESNRFLPPLDQR